MHKNEGKRVGRPAGAKFSACGAQNPSKSLIFGTPAEGREKFTTTPPCFRQICNKGGFVARNTIDWYHAFPQPILVQCEIKDWSDMGDEQNITGNVKSFIDQSTMSLCNF